MLRDLYISCNDISHMQFGSELCENLQSHVFEIFVVLLIINTVVIEVLFRYCGN